MTNICRIRAVKKGMTSGWKKVKVHGFESQKHVRLDLKLDKELKEDEEEEKYKEEEIKEKEEKYKDDDEDQEENIPELGEYISMDDSFGHGFESEVDHMESEVDHKKERYILYEYATENANLLIFSIMIFLFTGIFQMEEKEDFTTLAMLTLTLILMLAIKILSS